MKLLLTSGGVTNAAIREALIGMLGRPIADCDALFIPTAQWGQPACGPHSVWRSTSGASADDALVGLGWKSVGVLELTALPSLAEERWMPWVRDADVLLVDGGDARYLYTWLLTSNLAALLADLPELVWVGVSAGSMVTTPRVGREFLDWQPDGPDDTLGWVDFSIFPHLENPDLPHNTTAAAERWAATLPGPAYAIDDETAIVVTDDGTEVVSEGQWKHFPR